MAKIQLLAILSMDGCLADMKTEGSAEHLWTSTEVFDSNARAWGNYSVGTIECEACGKTWDVDMNVRPVLAF